MNGFRLGGLEGGQVWAGKGWAVFYPNPRGSSNYGQKTLAANVNDWGGGDFKDIMTGVDALVARGIADPDKLAHIGWSYGGYMTAWTITQTSRYKAAMVGAGLTNMWSMYGTNDIPSVLIAYFGGIPNKQTLPLYLDRSAMTHIDKVTTPTLILHGANDERVPTGPGLRAVSRIEGSRQGDRARVLSARRPRNHGVLSPERSNAADLRLGDEVHFRHRWKHDRTIASRTPGRRTPNCSRFSPSWPVRSARCWISAHLLEKIPNLISRLTNFTVFSVYLLNEQREELSIAYARRLPGRDRQALHAARSGRARSAPRSPNSGRSCSTTSIRIRATSRWCRARSRSWRCRCATRAR